MDSFCFFAIVLEHGLISLGVFVGQVVYLESPIAFYGIGGSETPGISVLISRGISATSFFSSLAFHPTLSSVPYLGWSRCRSEALCMINNPHQVLSKNLKR